MKRKEILVEGKERPSRLGKNNQVQTLNWGRPTICGECCKKHGINPNKNKSDMKTVEKLNAFFYYDATKKAIVCGHCGRELKVVKTPEDFETERLAKEKAREEKARKMEEERKANLHIVEVAHSWETGIKYYGLSARIDYDDWLKVKKYFHYHTASMDEDDEFFGPSPRGWVCIDYHAVEKALNIPAERTFDVLREKAQKEREESRKKEAEKKALIQECKDAFENAEKPEGEHIVVNGERIEDPDYPMNIYGGGHWWVIQDEHIWFIRNNGSDGANWGLNNVATGGAGAIGIRVPYSDELAEKIRRLKGI